jgi:hypothetical protein
MRQKEELGDLHDSAYEKTIDTIVDRILDLIFEER